MIVFVNFPSIVISLHSRPIYFDDLIIKNYEEEGHIYDQKFRKKYQNIFKWIASITSSLMIALTAELWFFRDEMFQGTVPTGKQAVNSFVVLGIIGGMLRLYYGATMILGRILLFILRRLKRREQERLRQVTQQRTLVELSSLGVSIGEDKEEESLIIPRTASHNDLQAHGRNIVGFKPTLMSDIFN